MSEMGRTPVTGRGYRPTMTSRVDLAAQFLALHHGAAPLLLPNAWDQGTAKLLESIGFAAIATTSGGHAATLGRFDGAVSQVEAIEHGRLLAGAVGIPVSADLENGFADDPAGVAATVGEARAVGLAGCSIEDYTGRDDDPIYAIGPAAERVAAAVEAAQADGGAFVITARAENHLRGIDDLADTIARLQAYQEAGAPVLYAPFLRSLADITSVITSVDRPVNVLALPGGPSVAELGAAGVARISLGSGLAFAAMATVVDAGRELLDHGTISYWDQMAVGGKAIGKAFSA